MILMYGPDEEFQRGYDNGWDAAMQYKQDQINEIIKHVESGDLNFEEAVESLREL